jgi:hypothetical protein
MADLARDDKNSLDLSNENLGTPRPSLIEVAGLTLEVGKVYSSKTQELPLPDGYKWSLMMYGLDYTRQGVNRMLLFKETEE